MGFATGARVRSYRQSMLGSMLEDDRPAPAATLLATAQAPTTAPAAGIAGNELAGPFAVGEYAAALRGKLRSFARVQLVGELVNLRPSRARVYFELRDATGAIPCAAWRADWEAMSKRAGTVREGVQVVVAGGCDYYAGSASASPSFSFGVSDLRIAGEGDLLARIDRLRNLDAEGLLERQRRLPRVLLPRTIGVVSGEGGKARDDVLAALARRGWAGRSCGASRPFRTATRRRRSAARWGTSRRWGAWTWCRRARRRLAGGPAVLLRRDAVPHGGAARGAGDRVGRPSHRPHAARRRGGGELLDADARGGGRGGRPLRAGAAGALASGARAARSRPPRGAGPGARAGGLSRAPAAQLARQRADLHQQLREMRAGGAAARGGRARAHGAARAGAGAQERGDRAGLPVATPRELEQLALALAAHDPQRTLERGYALVESPAGEPLASAAATRAQAACDCDSPMGRWRPRSRTSNERAS